MSVELVKKNALTVIEEASNINTKYSFENLSKSLLEMQNTVKNFKINAPLIGLFSAGKSSILNKYLNIDLPVGIEAKTSVACEFVYDTDEYLEVVSDKNESSRKSIAELKDLTIENCSFVRMHLNSDKLMNLKDITIVDMPGLDSGYEQHNKAIKNYISSASYFIIIMDIENGTIKKSLLDFLKELDLYKLKFGFILSKYEQKEESDIEDIIKNTEETILNHIGEKVFVGKVSPHNSDIEDFENILTETSKERYKEEHSNSKISTACSFLNSQPQKTVSVDELTKEFLLLRSPKLIMKVVKYIYSLQPEAVRVGNGVSIVYSLLKGENLGKIEYVIGKGKVIHLQDTMATIESTEIITTLTSKKTIKKINNVFGLPNEETIIEPEEQLVSFSNCKKGYLAKSI